MNQDMNVPIHFAQINLGKRIEATVELANRAGSSDIDIFLITEPRSNKGKILGLPTTSNGFNQFYQSNEKARAAVLVRNNINAILLNNLTNSDFVTILIKSNNNEEDLIVVSYYADGTYHIA